MNLIVVESPTKARTLSRFLGKDYSVEATMGHIKDLPKSKLGVDVKNDFAPDYQVVEDKSKSIAKITREAKRAKSVYLATDPDREGEAIAAHVVEILNSKRKTQSAKLSRIIFHEITKSAVEHAIDSPRDIDKNRVDAQIARRVLDRLVGYKLSPLLWKKVRRGLSAGRVQSVAVRLIVEREREIKAFVPEEYWEIFSKLKTQNSELKTGEFTAKLIKIDDKKAEVKDGKTAKVIASDLEKSDYKVSDVKKKEVRRSPYPPFTTSTMTQSAARLFHWSAKKTMTVAQRLYEEGLITYHRTDSTNIASAAVSNVRDFIKKEYGDKYLPEKPKFYKTKSKSAQEAHEAIRPARVNAKLKTQNAKLRREKELLYGLIWKRFVACQMEASVYDETKIDVVASSNVKAQMSKRYLLRASGQVMKFEGWRAAYGEVKTQNAKLKTNGEIQLPEVKKDEALDLIKVISEQKFTQPPPRYGEASLVKTLEKLGIGRPSTYAPIISTIQVRNYVEKTEGRFHPTNVGIAVNDFLIASFARVFDYGFTAEMEDNLDNVAHGKRKWQKMMKDFYTPFEKKLGSVEEKAKRVKIETEKLGKKCPKCKKGELVIRTGRFGKFISCSRFPDCRHTEKYENRIGMKCPDCGKGHVIVKKTKRGRQFYGCSRYPKCNFASWKKPKA
jgi:DNA topoisomerase-1